MYRERRDVNPKCTAHHDKIAGMGAADRLRDAREAAGFETAADAARRYGWPETTYRHHENGTRGFRLPSAKIYARAFRVAPEWLLFGKGGAERSGVPVVGYIGAGAEIYPIDQGGSLDEVEAPPGVGPEAVAVIVRGDSMWPRYTDGDTIIYDQHLPAEKADRRECVIALPDGRKYVKMVRRQPDGLWTLESHNAPPIHDAELLWAAPIRWIIRG